MAFAKSPKSDSVRERAHHEVTAIAMRLHAGVIVGPAHNGVIIRKTDKLCPVLNNLETSIRHEGVCKLFSKAGCREVQDRGRATRRVQQAVANDLSPLKGEIGVLNSAFFESQGPLLRLIQPA